MGVGNHSNNSGINEFTLHTTKPGWACAPHPVASQGMILGTAWTKLWAWLGVAPPTKYGTNTNNLFIVSYKSPCPQTLIYSDL